MRADELKPSFLSLSKQKQLDLIIHSQNQRVAPFEKKKKAKEKTDISMLLSFSQEELRELKELL